MKKVLSLCFVFLLLLSCNKKKEEKKEDIHQELPIIEQQIPKETVVEQASEIEEETSELIFTVQIAALRNANENLSSIDGIQIYQENTLTKYRIGNFKTYQEAKDFRNQILEEYKDAFVQALKNESPISIVEALQN